MLEELRIVGLGVIDESVLELGPGFTAITGETGAGKTMLVTALGLLLGGRADSGAVRTGARHARVEGVLDLGGSELLEDLSATVDEAGGQLDGSRLMLARHAQVDGPVRPQGIWKVFVETDDAQALFDRAVAAGAEAVAPPAHLEQFHVTIAFVRDPDGYLLELGQIHPR